MTRDLRASWAIAKKDIKIYYLTPPTLMFGILFPLFMFLSFAVGRNIPPGSLAPALISITLLFSASSIGPAVIPTERKVKTYDRLLSAPVSLYAIVVGKTLSGFIFSFIIGCLMTGLLIMLFGAQLFSAVALLGGLTLGSLCFSMLGIMLAMLPRENSGDIMLLLNFIRLPLIFISGVFINVEGMPFWGQIASLLSPLTYSNELVRTAFEGKSAYDPLVCGIVLLAYTALFLFLGKKIDAKFRG